MKRVCVHVITTYCVVKQPRPRIYITASLHVYHTFYNEQKGIIKWQ